MLGELSLWFQTLRNSFFGTNEDYGSYIVKATKSFSTFPYKRVQKLLENDEKQVFYEIELTSDQVLYIQQNIPYGFIALEKSAEMSLA